MKKLLIVRSVSLQQLDSNILKIKEYFKDYEIHMLTHEHSVKLVEKYQDVKKIWVYPYKKSFSYFDKMDEIKEKYDAILLPVTNLSGSSFANVFLFGLSIKADKRYFSNLVADIKELKTGMIVLGYVWGIVKKIISAFVTGVIAIPVMLVVLWNMMCRGK